MSEGQHVPTPDEFRRAGFTHQARHYPRSDLAFRMLCAFNGASPKNAPRAWAYYANKSMKDCWERAAAVAAAEFDHDGLLDEMLAALNAILHSIDDGGVPLAQALQMANAVIARAEGRA